MDKKQTQLKNNVTNEVERGRGTLLQEENPCLRSK